MKQVYVKRIARFLGKRENALSFERVKDPRGKRGRRWKLPSLLTATFVAMVAMERSFRGAERLSRDLNGCRKRLGIPRRVPDSTLSDLWARIDDERGLRKVLVDDIKRARRRKSLEPTSLPINAVAITNAQCITDAQMRYVMAVKDSQPTLLAEAKRLCGWGEHKQVSHKRECATPWEQYRGNKIRRELFRSGDIRGWHGWETARQVWRVKKTVKKSDGTLTVSNRYFVTSVPWDRLKGSEILTLVRLHWGVENGCHWTLDVPMQEDSRCWCTGGKALRMLSWMRLLAYNTLRFLRDRYLRSKKTVSWDELKRRITMTLMLPRSWVGLNSPEIAPENL